jgi:DNA mismatch repair protein MutS
MMEQYFRIKERHRGALLFFRLGDFYEMFLEDAKIASPVLEIALTSRQKIPMCGVPHFAVDAYAAKLLRRGFKVAICEQVEDPRTAKGVVKREVIKVLTPGTAVEVEAAEARESLFVAALLVEAEGWALAYLDLAAGDIRVLDGGAAEIRALQDELFKAAPREVVCPEGDEDEVRRLLARAGLDGVVMSPVEAWTFEPVQAARALRDHFAVPTLAGFDLEGRPRAAAAAGALLQYVKAVRRDSAGLVRGIASLRSGDALVLDAATVRNLEIVRSLRDGRVKGSLLDVMDETVTAMGGRLLREWLLRPLLAPDRIRARHDAVEEALRLTIERTEVRELLRTVHDLERLAGKAGVGAAHPRDLVALKKSLRPLARVAALLGPFAAALLCDLREHWDPAADVADLIDRAILDEPAFLLAEGGIVRDGYDAELDELRAVSRSGKTFIAELERRERERTGIGSLKVRFNKVFGYSIEVTKSNLPLVPPDYERKQTLVGAERFQTAELREYEAKVLHAEERIGALEHRLFLETRDAVAREAARLQRLAADVAALDALFAFAELAARRGYVRPEIHDGDSLRIEAGRHPVVEVSQAEPFIPNDAFLDAEQEQILVITGPNMGGKSTYLRQTALICLMAQAGSFVPARSASLGVVDRIFTRIGASDYLTAGQSTFMVEMIETAAILRSATPRSLILLDEVGRGTSTFDGLSIAWAVAEHLHENPAVRAKTLFATHYHELTELALTLTRIRNYHVAVEEWRDEVVFLRRIVPGPSDRSYGLHVAKLAGLPGDVLARARQILFNLERAELDDAGRPRLAYRDAANGDSAQLLLFAADREAAALEDVKNRLLALDVEGLTPREALEILGRLRDGIVPREPRQ